MPDPDDGATYWFIHGEACPWCGGKVATNGKLKWCGYGVCDWEAEA